MLIGFVAMGGGQLGPLSAELGGAVDLRPCWFHGGLRGEPDAIAGTRRPRDL
jgi:hypothetical protein